MAWIDGNTAAQENLTEIAKLCCMAALRAPQMTGKVKVKTEIITGDDILPLVEYGESLLAASMKALPDALPTFLRARVLISHRERYEEGRPPAFVLIGSSSFLRSELNWDCGACGWPTCADFNRYSTHIKKTVKGRQVGPCCSWKYMDYMSAVNWACIVPWQNNVEARMLSVEGHVFHALGYQQDCADTQAIGLGPCGDLLWFARGTPMSKLDKEMEEVYLEFSYKAMPTLWNTFFGTMVPLFKYDPRRYQTEKKYLKVEEEPPSPAIEKARREHLERVVQIRMKVEERKRAARAAELPPEATEEERQKALGPPPTEERLMEELLEEWPLLMNVIGGGQI